MNQNEQMREVLRRIVEARNAAQHKPMASPEITRLWMRINEAEQFLAAKPARPIAINGQMKQALEFFIERFEPMRSELRFSQRLAIDKAKAAIEAAKAAEGNL